MTATLADSTDDTLSSPSPDTSAASLSQYLLIHSCHSRRSCASFSPCVHDCMLVYIWYSSRHFWSCSADSPRASSTIGCVSASCMNIPSWFGLIDGLDACIMSWQVARLAEMQSRAAANRSSPARLMHTKRNDRNVTVKSAPVRCMVSSSESMSCLSSSSFFLINPSFSRILSMYRCLNIPSYSAMMARAAAGSSSGLSASANFSQFHLQMSGWFL
mmetsp:Transcript_18688/g.44974  ORF Transcript_18688/g.44974 Transcript_18688/m.44974 type:complete len:216 (+) Transcript_18688:819-1466(+)